MTQPPYQPPNQQPVPPGYPQTPPYGDPRTPHQSYPQAPPQSYPPSYPQGPGYPPGYGPAYGYQPAYSPRGGQPYGGPAPGRRLLWSWIGFIGAAVIVFGLAIAFATQWTLAASRLGQPDNTWATYGTVTAVQGSDVVVQVTSGTPSIRRTETRVFNRTSSSTATTHVYGGFTSTITGAPATPIGAAISFTYTTSDLTHGRYLAVAPSRIKKVGTIPAEVGPLFVVGIVAGLVGVILFITWVVRLRRNRRPAAPMYSAPPSYWPPNPPQP